MEKLNKIKEKGNKLFSAENYTAAINQYEEALTMVNFRF
jgi:hypothetical protein